MAWRVPRSMDHTHALRDLAIVGIEVESALFLQHRYRPPPLEVLLIGGPGEERPVGGVHVVNGVRKPRPAVRSTGATSVISMQMRVDDMPDVIP